MAFRSLPLLVLVAIYCLMANSSSFSAREIPTKPELLAGNIEAAGGIVECWNALAEVKSCADEIMIFIRDGKTSISPRCCEAISLITRNCLPSMLTSLGFTLDQTYILRGYCDEEEAKASSSGPAQAPHA